MNKTQKNQFSGLLFYGISLLTALVLAMGCSSGSNSGSGVNAAMGEGFLVIENLTTRDFTVTLSGQATQTTNETVATVSAPNLVTNVSTATDGVTLITNVVNNPVETMVTNAVLEAVAPEPVVVDAVNKRSTPSALPANTYRVLFAENGGMRVGETSVIIREGARTSINVLLNPDNATGLQLRVSN